MEKSKGFSNVDYLNKNYPELIKGTNSGTDTIKNETPHNTNKTIKEENDHG